jgi:DNA-directed RNA polymerase specialized sigma24 family protein
MDEEILKYLKVLVYLQARAQFGGDEESKPEVALHKAGLSREEIADLLGKSTNAVNKTIQRSR